MADINKLLGPSASNSIVVKAIKKMNKDEAKAFKDPHKIHFPDRRYGMTGHDREKNQNRVGYPFKETVFSNPKESIPKLLKYKIIEKSGGGYRLTLLGILIAEELRGGLRKYSHLEVKMKQECDKKEKLDEAEPRFAEVLDAIKKANNVILKGNKYTVSDTSKDWIELEDKRGIPKIVKIRDISSWSNKGKDVLITTEGLDVTKTKQAKRIGELSKYLSEQNPYYMKGTKATDKKPAATPDQPDEIDHQGSNIDDIELPDNAEEINDNKENLGIEDPDIDIGNMDLEEVRQIVDEIFKEVSSLEEKGTAIAPHSREKTRNIFGVEHIWSQSMKRMMPRKMKADNGKWLYWNEKKGQYTPTSEQQ